MQNFLINADEKTEMWSKILIIHEKSLVENLEILNRQK